MKLAAIILAMPGTVAAGAATILVQTLPALKQKEIPTVDDVNAVDLLPGYLPTPKNLTGSATMAKEG